MERFTFVNGTARVHDASACSGENCCIHRPSMHAMVEEPMVLRESTLVERLCRHGVGHPDPDSVAFMERSGGKYWGVHGCDGCCSKLVPA
jgi:hypothetical protein